MNKKTMGIINKVRIGFFFSTLYTVILCLVAANMINNSESIKNHLAVVQGIVLVCVVMAVITGFVMARIIVKSIRKPLEQLTYCSNELVKGNSDIKLEKCDNDELGSVANGFEQVIEATQMHAKIAHQISQGDLTVDVKIRSEHDVLGMALKELVDDNNSVLLGIKESSMQLTSGAGQVASASQALAQGSTEQASAIEQITASMSDIAKDINHTADITNTADQVVRAMQERAVVSNEQMNHMMQAMEAIQDASHSISKVIKTIDDIAFQTNILALNATVEAARAGVHGKGFAVVAEEVKNLAEKSAAAAAETAELIQSSIDRVEEGSKFANDTAQALGGIVTDLGVCVEQIDEISTAANQQATAVAQINQAISQVSQVVQTNSATSEECASASEELSNQAMALRNMISKYKLTESKGRNMMFENSFGQTSSQAFGSAYNSNEQIISLDGGFGKY